MGIKTVNYPLDRNIRKIIKERGLKKYAVAVKAGYPAQQFSNMLNGRKIIKPCDALAIAEALEITMDEMFGEREDAKNGN